MWLFDGTCTATLTAIWRYMYHHLDDYLQVHVPPPWLLLFHIIHLRNWLMCHMLLVLCKMLYHIFETLRVTWDMWLYYPWGNMDHHLCSCSSWTPFTCSEKSIIVLRKSNHHYKLRWEVLMCKSILVNYVPRGFIVHVDPSKVSFRRESIYSWRMFKIFFWSRWFEETHENTFRRKAIYMYGAVSYTHLTLPTNREV